MEFKAKSAPSSYTTQTARRLAYGTFTEENPEMKRILVALDGCFEPKHKPGPSDWLSQKIQRGQTFKQYKELRKPIDESRQTIYVQPLEGGELPDDIKARFLEVCVTFYTGMNVKLRKSVPMSQLTSVKKMKLPNGIDPQFNVSHILKAMVPWKPDDTHCMLGVTFADLYRPKNQRYPAHTVRGFAGLPRLGIFSLFRFLPEELQPFFRTTGNPEEVKISEEHWSLVTRSCCKVMCHEIGHMFGLPHCIYYECLMNGANQDTLDEFKRRPMLLCNVCLRKLQYRIGFDITKRYKDLMALYQKLGGEFTQDFKRVKKILGVLSGERAKPGQSKSMGTAKLVRGASGTRVGAKLIVKPPSVAPPTAPLRLPKIAKTEPTKRELPMKVITPGGLGLVKPGSSKTRGGSLARGSAGLSLRAL